VGLKCDVLIKDGFVVLPGKIAKLNICIKDGRICALTDRPIYSAEEIIEAKGKYVLPGIIDPHINAFSEHDDFMKITEKAIKAGITTFMGIKEVEDISKLKVEIKRYSREAYCNFSFHAQINKETEKSFDNIFKLIHFGIPSISISLSDTFDTKKVSDSFLFRALHEAQRYGGLITLFAENNDIVSYYREKYLKEGKLDFDYHFKSHPGFAEFEAVQRAIIFAEESFANLYIFSVSTKESIAYIGVSTQLGHNIFGEVSLSHIFLTKDCYFDENASHYLTVPPFRTEEDQRALKLAIKNGIIKVLTSNHAEDYQRGLPVAEELLPSMYTFFVKPGRMTFEQLVRLLSYNPARIFGLYPEKGEIGVNFDADIVIFDGEEKQKVSGLLGHEEVYGRVKLVMIKGRTVYKDGSLKEKQGRFIKRIPLG